MPDLDAPHVENRGVMELGGDFPASFLSGLVPATEYGVTVYPVAIRIDEATGNAAFFNAAETPFYTVPRIAPVNWFALLHPLLATNPWFDESRMVAQWTLVPSESLDAYLAAINAPPPPLRSLHAPAGLEITNLMFTAISVSELAPGRTATETVFLMPMKHWSRGRIRLILTQTATVLGMRPN